MLKGSKMTEEQRRRISVAKLGRPNGRKGCVHSPETKRAISQITKERTAKGTDHYAWKGGTKVQKHGDRGTAEYAAWRKAVFERDKYTCVICTSYTGGGNLEAHHLKSYPDHPELRYSVDNGVTLCNYHHQREVHDGRKN